MARRCEKILRHVPVPRRSRPVRSPLADNFCRIHKTLRITHAMAAGLTDRLWSIGDMVKVLEDWENTT
jgi:hypothetical protein